MVTLASGFLLSLSLPPADIGPVAFVALVPLLWLLQGARMRRGFLLGLAFGFGYFGAVLYWILLFGEGAYLALVLVSAISLAIFGALAPSVLRAEHPLASVVAIAGLWTGIDWLRGLWPLGGFTWGTLATTQVGNPLTLPLASVAGGFGITFVVVAVNALVLFAVRSAAGRRPAPAVGAVAVSVVLVVAPALLPDPVADGRQIDVASLQFDVRRAEGLDPVAEDRAIAAEHLRGHARLASDPPDLAIWGESALDPGASDPATLRAVGKVVRSVGSPTLLGAAPTGPRGVLNAAFLFDGEGDKVDSSAKVHLVPFGEYVPFRRWLGWFDAIDQIPYDKVPGESPHPLVGAGLPPIGTAICFENSFPEIERELTREGAQILFVLTNNASYEETAASAQHLLMSRLRAVENARWTVHAAISGISAIVDPSGRVVTQTKLFEDTIMRGTVRASTQVTWATRLGNWVPLLSLATFFGVFLLPRRRRRDRGAPRPLPTEPRTLIVLPTYNERATIGRVIERLLALPERVDVLVVDDSSPDGTGELVGRQALREPRVRLVERTRKGGLASAYSEGFAVALPEGYDLVVEMDSDLSHDPEELSSLLAAAGDHDLVIGSRYVAGGSVTNWSRGREALSRAGNMYARVALGVPFRDTTSGFRVFRRSALAQITLEAPRADGYGFQIELALRAWNAGYSVAEVPITFRERQYGHSKISRRIVAEAWWLVTAWGVKARLGGPHGAATRTPTS